jgi:hypothetical protein
VKTLLILAALALGGCTLVFIRGDGNTISDTGGHGLWQPATPHPLENLLKDKTQGGH